MTLIGTKIFKKAAQKSVAREKKPVSEHFNLCFSIRKPGQRYSLRMSRAKPAAAAAAVLANCKRWRWPRTKKREGREGKRLRSYLPLGQGEEGERGGGEEKQSVFLRPPRGLRTERSFCCRCCRTPYFDHCMHTC